MLIERFFNDHSPFNHPFFTDSVRPRINLYATFARQAIQPKVLWAMKHQAEVMITQLQSFVASCEEYEKQVAEMETEYEAEANEEAAKAKRKQANRKQAKGK